MHLKLRVRMEPGKYSRRQASRLADTALAFVAGQAGAVLAEAFVDSAFSSACA
ncbi:hypothetical protein [Roseinatronobacter alkalisoli]|uniref:Transposase n=1 Tax=Roseinatronobacter alkalisoli TaxID=3028235 RepID=A0ABT5T6F5_9RHOB|nr:hypothetical protein [Roseinatronobacter sp. HJB301]MDD7970629.1 hypothetical protein [Roseinatronobacter sp. HJB301]